MRQRADLVERRLHLRHERSLPVRPRNRVLAQCVLRELELDAERHQALLGTVVEVVLDRRRSASAEVTMRARDSAPPRVSSSPPRKTPVVERDARVARGSPYELRLVPERLLVNDRGDLAIAVDDVRGEPTGARLRKLHPLPRPAAKTATSIHVRGSVSSGANSSRPSKRVTAGYPTGRHLPTGARTSAGVACTR